MECGFKGGKGGSSELPFWQAALLFTDICTLDRQEYSLDCLKYTQ